MDVAQVAKHIGSPWLRNPELTLEPETLLLDAPQFAVQRRLVGLGAVTLFALVAHLAFLSALPVRWRANQSADYFQFYEPVAHNLLAGKGLVTGDGKPALEFPPGFPVELAGTFAAARALGISEGLALRLHVGFCVGLTAMLIYLIAAQIFGLRTAVIAAILWSTYPLQLWLTKQPDSGHLFNIILLAAVYLFLHFGRGKSSLSATFLIGSLVGIGSLVRPIGIALSVVFLCGLWNLGSQLAAKRRAVLASMMIVGNLLAIVPWEWWAHSVSSRWIPLSTNGPASILDGITLSASRPSRGLTVRTPAAARDLIGEYLGRESSLTTGSAIVAFTLHEAVRNPLGVVELFALKAARAWYANDSQQFEGLSAAVQAPYILLCACGLWFTRQHGGVRRAFVSFALLLALYFWAMTVLTLSIVRYMLPAMAVLVIFAARLLSSIQLHRNPQEDRAG